MQGESLGHTHTYIQLQFQVLRQEIDSINDRLFRIIVGGAGVVPVAQFVADTLHLSVVTLLLPMIVLIVVFLFLSQQNAMMRCGCYIREQLEPAMFGATDVMGWEMWLESPSHASDLRNVDKYLVYAFYLLITVYFVVSVALAISFLQQNFGAQAAVGGALGYGALAIVGGIALRRGVVTTSLLGF